MIIAHRYVPDPYRNTCICGELKKAHKYKSTLSIVKIDDKLWSYNYAGEELPFLTGEDELK